VDSAAESPLDPQSDSLVLQAVGGVDSHQVAQSFGQWGGSQNDWEHLYALLLKRSGNPYLFSDPGGVDGGRRQEYTDHIDSTDTGAKLLSQLCRRLDVEDIKPDLVTVGFGDLLESQGFQAVAGTVRDEHAHADPILAC
jgi:hypothetical protein